METTYWELNREKTQTLRQIFLIAEVKGEKKKKLNINYSIAKIC